MKKKMVCVGMSLLLCASFLCQAIAKESTPMNTFTEEAIQNALLAVNPETFGGMYYEEDGEIVFCTTVTEENIPSLNSLDNVSTVYKTVQYSLAELEEMKASLEKYMLEYSIISLDANERTNKVTIEVTNDSDALTLLVKDLLPEDAYEIISLSSDVSITESINYVNGVQDIVPIESASDNEARFAPSIFPGALIYFDTITAGYFGEVTAGPRRSSMQFYTVGHAVEIQTAYVYQRNEAFVMTKIGAASNIVHGLGGDRATVTISSGSISNTTPLGDTYSFGNLISGTSVYFCGGKSGVKFGGVDQTNLTVAVDGVIVGGLSSATYSAVKGDSGGGVFSSSGSTVCGGIQCAIREGGSIPKSYFSPIN